MLFILESLHIYVYRSQLASQSYTFTAWHGHLLDDNTSSTQCGSHSCFEISMGVQSLLRCRWTCLVGRQSAVGKICPCWTLEHCQWP